MDKVPARERFTTFGCLGHYIHGASCLASYNTAYEVRFVALARPNLADAKLLIYRNIIRHNKKLERGWI